MVDLIDRESLVVSLFPLSKKDAADIYGIIMDAPTINHLDFNKGYSTERHGKWVYDETIGGMKYYYCTSCKECNAGSECIADENQIMWFAFCPKCGAKMDVEK